MLTLLQDDWVRKFTANDTSSWILADVALTGYTCIIFMLRTIAGLSDSSTTKPVSSDIDIPKSPLVLTAARRILGFIDIVLARFPSPQTLSLIFGAYQAYVPYACLVSSVLGAPDMRLCSNDVALLLRVGESITITSQKERDFVPLSRAVQSLNMEIRKRMDCESS